MVKLLDNMDMIKEFVTAAVSGACDCFKGVPTLFRVDKELNRRKLSRLSPTHSSSPVRRRTSESREQTPARTLQKHEESTVLNKVCMLIFINGGLFLSSIFIYELVILRLIQATIMFIFGQDSENGQYVWFWVDLLLNVTFQTIWVVPFLAVSKIINLLWFQDIGQSAYKYSRGRSTASLGLSKTVADYMFSSVVEILFLIQAQIMTYFPLEYLGYGLHIIHLSLLYSLYAFEYKWCEMGLEIHKRLECIETHWPYFVGFGLPLAFVSQISSSWIINGCIFSMLFPLYIIAANEATPSSEFCSPVKIFAPVIAVSNSLFRVFGKEKKQPVHRPLLHHRR